MNSRPKILYTLIESASLTRAFIQVKSFEKTRSEDCKYGFIKCLSSNHKETKVIGYFRSMVPGNTVSFYLLFLQFLKTSFTGTPFLHSNCFTSRHY